MVLYNVTVCPEADIEAEFISWLKETHIPEVMESGCFVEWKMFKIQTEQPDQNLASFSIQYFAQSFDHLEEYQANHAPALQAKTKKKYGEKVLAFRTILEQI